MNALDVTAAGDVPVLLLAGMILLGNLQDRALDLPVLVPAARTVRVPVSCVEQGRWGSGRAATTSARVVPPTMRARNLDAVARNVAAGHGTHGDQHGMWASVDAYAARIGADAPTRSLEDVHAAAADRTASMVAGTSPLPGQRGVVAAPGSRIVGVDLFDRPGVLAEHWDAIVAGYALDATDPVDVRRRQVRPSSATSPGRRWARRRRSASAPPSTPTTSVAWLAWDDVVVHLAAGATA